MSNNIRVGKVSSIDYEKGMIKVVYADKDDSVTNDLPFLTFNGEYKMPNIDDMVLVLHLSNGSAMGVTMGTFWNDKNKPGESKKGLYRKEFGPIHGEAYMRYDTDTKTLTIKADTIQLLQKTE